MRALPLLVAAAFVAAVFLLMLTDAVDGGDWPGWDEGWALVAFPLGVPLVLAAALAAARVSRPLRVITTATLAVWTWGALVFVLWYVVGS
ncbi:MAG TPA: hypothetical protein VFY02_03910 [Gaiellaceae bacterium]|nr:hypothetical protein [Gaiellaceae bacterium]